MPEDQDNSFQPTRQYLLSEGQVRAAFILSAVGMTALLLLLLILATAKPESRFVEADPTEFRQGLTAATSALSGYEMFEDGRARLDIDRAMELVAERGVQSPGMVAAGASAAAPGGAQEGAAPGADAGSGADDDEQALPAVDGAVAYGTCAACHQANGAGIPGAFPPLAGHAAELYQADPSYMIDVVLYGLTGQIQVDGVSYNGFMPSHEHLADAEIAAILNHVMTSFGNEEAVDSFEAYTEADVEAQRGLELSSDEVHALRADLNLE
ncbi:MAG TPA: cytochrome c [Trueperaceae bacterium]|nr:cytochrome c [Trueperaceae bacterium]